MLISIDDADNASVSVLVGFLNVDDLAECQCGKRSFGLLSPGLPQFGGVDAVQADFDLLSVLGEQSQGVAVADSNDPPAQKRLRLGLASEGRLPWRNNGLRRRRGLLRVVIAAQ